ncbi:MAG: TIGR00725 family protein [Deltaproteobacteria bacterium]|nr:TIGR00725 family protein [Deltaproteobacteria bacterium]
MGKVVIGVMGGGEGSPRVLEAAETLGRLIAENGWVLLNGGRPAGVMEASARGASRAGGLVVGILPGGPEEGASRWVDVPVYTCMGAARNAVNVLSSDVVVAMAGGAGTLSEIALAVKLRRPLVLLENDPGPAVAAQAAPGLLAAASSPEEAVEKIREFLG